MSTTPKVFLSYASADRDRALDIYEFLRDSGCDPWIDVKDLLPGQDWRREIEIAIEKSDFFIACLSSNSVNKRGYVQKELKKGLDVLEQFPEGEVYLIPMRLGECQVPHSLSRYQWLDWDSLDSRRRLLDTIGLPSPKEVEAKITEVEAAMRDAIDWATSQRRNNLFDPQTYVQYSIGKLTVTAAPNLAPQIEGTCLAATPSARLTPGQREALASRKGWNYERPDASDIVHIWTSEKYIADPDSLRDRLGLEQGEPIFGPLYEPEIASEIVAVNVEIFGLSPGEITIEKKRPRWKSF